MKPTDTGEEKDEDLSKKTEGRLTRHRNRKPPIKFRDGVYEVTKMITTNDGKYWLESMFHVTEICTFAISEFYY